MDRYITITSKDQDASEFVSKFADNLNLEDGYEVGLKAIYHAPVYNLPQEESKFFIHDAKTDKEYMAIAPAGFYENEADLLGMMYIGVEQILAAPGFVNTDADGNELTKPEIIFIKNTNGHGLELRPARRLYFVVGPSSPIFRHLGYIFPEDTHQDRIIIAGARYKTFHIPGYIYSNCVENSIIDEQQSRLLAIVPLAMKASYNHYIIENPNYIPLATQSLRDVSFAICDVHGKNIQFEYKNDNDVVSFPTILCLHLRRRV